MFSFTFSNASTLSSVVEATKDLAESVNFSLDDNGLGFVTMDSAHVALVRAHFPRSDFSSFEHSGNANFGVHLGSLNKVLKFAKSDEPLTFRTVEDGDSITMESGSASVQFKLIDIDSEEFGMPEFERDAFVELSSAEFKNIVKDLSVIGDTMKVSVYDKTAIFSTSGDVGTVTLRISNGDNGAKVDGTFSGAEFSLKYLVSFGKASNVSKSSRIILSGEMPLEIEFQNLSFFLAPKISDDFDEAEPIDE
jgi:proliferating cell nuclear antigen